MSVFSFAPRPSTRHCPHLLLSAGEVLPIDISFFAGLSAVGAECSLISCARRHDNITPVLATLHRLPVATEIRDLEKPRFSFFWPKWRRKLLFSRDFCSFRYNFLATGVTHHPPAIHTLSAPVFISLNSNCAIARKECQAPQTFGIVPGRRAVSLRHTVRLFCLQCFDAVGWAEGRASGL